MAQAKRRIVVVGAGPGGLTAAMILAHRGFAVTVVERKSRVGGRNARLDLGPYKFDTGPTFLMMKQILDQCFAEAGADSGQLLEFTRLDPMYRLQFAKFALHATQDIERLKSEVACHFPGREAGVGRFMNYEKRRFEHMLPCLQKHYSTLGSLFSRNLLAVLPYLSLGRKVFDVLKGYFGEDELAISFSFQSKYLGMSPWECPGYFAMLAYIEYAFGVYHVTGGLSEISEKMAEQAVRNGAEIRLDTEVEQILLQGRRAVGVRLLGGEEIKCDDIVLNADFGDAMSRLIPPGVLRKYRPEKLAKKRFSCSTFMLYLGIDKELDLPHHTIYFADDYRRNVEDIFSHRGLSRDTSFYVRNATATDRSLAPAGHSAVYILVPVGNLRSPVDWAGETAGFRDLVVRRWCEKAGLGDLEPHIREEKILTPEDWRDDYRVYCGATFNLAHTTRQMVYLRPRNRFEELRRCYLVGGGTHPGSGLPTIYESGRIAANLLSRFHGVPFTSGNLNC